MRLRKDFLNWRPDAEDFGNEGLTVATNVIHDSEGWKPCPLQSTGAFSTTGGLASVTSIVTKRIGPSTDTFSAWLSGDTLNVGINGVTATSSTTGYPVAFATTGSNQAITFFDTCEISVSTGSALVYFVTEAQQNQGVPSTVAAIRTAGYFTITAL